MTEQLTHAWLAYSGVAQQIAMHHLGRTEWSYKIPTKTLEDEVILEALRAYDMMVASGDYTRGSVPKAKTGKQREIEAAVFRTLLELAHFVLNPNRNTSVTEEQIRAAWRAGKEQSA